MVALECAVVTNHGYNINWFKEFLESLKQLKAYRAKGFTFFKGITDVKSHVPAVF